MTVCAPSEPKIIDTGVDAIAEDDLERPAPYYARATPIPTKPGCWNYNNIEVIERDTGKVVGSYVYKYMSPARTFHPFKLRGKWYALYSTDYTATRVMSLPDCKDLGGEDPECFGFCPVDYYVPPLHDLVSRHWDSCPRHESIKDYSKPCICRFAHKEGCPLGVPNPKVVNGGYEWDKCICKKELMEFNEWHSYWTFPERVHGFVAGCVWGDDSSWKIQYLDLSRADEGIVKREERFGYLEMPENLTLDKAVKLDVSEGHFSLKIASEKWYNFQTGEERG